MSMQKNFDHIAQPWSKRPNADILPIYRNDTWFYAHHPLSWELVVFEHTGAKGKTKRIPLLLPSVQKIPHVSGVNGVRDGGDLTIMQGQLNRDGWIVLSPREHNYMQIYPAIGGSYHSTRFMKIQKLAGRVIKTFLHKEFNNWRKDLVASGALSLPHEHVLKLMDIEAQDKLNSTLRDSHLPHIAKRKSDLEQYQKDLSEAITNANDRSNYE